MRTSEVTRFCSENAEIVHVYIEYYSLVRIMCQSVVKAIVIMMMINRVVTKAIRHWV